MYLSNHTGAGLRYANKGQGPRVKKEAGNLALTNVAFMTLDP